MRVTRMVLPLLLTLPALAGQPTKRPSDEERGRVLYGRHCLQCHGDRANGDGPATAALVHDVGDLMGRVVADDETVRLVLRGRVAMPGFEPSFDASDAKRVLKYMSTLGTKKAWSAAPPKKAATPKKANDKVVEANEEGEPAAPLADEAEPAAPLADEAEPAVPPTDEAEPAGPPTDEGGD